MKIIQTDDFKKSLQKLPSATERSFSGQQSRFLTNPRHPSLHTKKLKDLEGVYSFSVGRTHRALFFFDSDGNAIFFAIGQRKDMYR